jgi:hypothetical protein
MVMGNFVYATITKWCLSIDFIISNIPVFFTRSHSSLMFLLELLVMLGLGEVFFETTFNHNKILRTNFLIMYAIEHIDV